jgi:hypothetical protein
MVHPVGQQAHLGVAAFAGMLAQDLGQGDYPLERQQHLGVEDVSTPSAARANPPPEGCSLPTSHAGQIR